ncbi:hypothetical protein F511_28220 [Dorcoceras hygrometricum]|uniref:Uncharacterized protein n=1 Tax=Dorcoceras hygrometricum TaxID=472368 RepID=A0A2Z7CQE5_9LAMI|nr:hypothetical protein F511_28220 [Dorcoceras hygrometricum]
MSLFDLQDVCIAIGSLATLDLPMIVDLIGIYVLKGPYCTLTTTNWFLQALSVIPRGYTTHTNPRLPSWPPPPPLKPHATAALRRRVPPPSAARFVIGLVSITATRKRRRVRPLKPSQHQLHLAYLSSNVLNLMNIVITTCPILLLGTSSRPTSSSPRRHLNKSRGYEKYLSTSAVHCLSAATLPASVSSRERTTEYRTTPPSELTKPQPSHHPRLQKTSEGSSAET